MTHFPKNDQLLRKKLFLVTVIALKPYLTNLFDYFFLKLDFYSNALTKFCLKSFTVSKLILFRAYQNLGYRTNICPFVLKVLSGKELPL